MLTRLSLALIIASAAPAVAEELLYPFDVTVDGNGGIYVADHEAHALLVLRDGAFEVVARGEGLPRTPLYGIRHVTVAVGGNGFVASDPATMKLYRVSATGTIEPVADDDRFVTPWGIAVEPSGSILAVDRVTHRLRRVAADGTVEDVAEIRAPRAVLFDKEGAIVVLTDKTLVRVTGGNAAPIVDSTPFEFPHDAVFHPNGNFYVTDGYARAIWRVGSNGAVEPLVQGEPLVSPQGIALDREGNLLVADAHARAIFKVTPAGELSRLP